MARGYASSLMSKMNNSNTAATTIMTNNDGSDYRLANDDADAALGEKSDFKMTTKFQIPHNIAHSCSSASSDAKDIPLELSSLSPSVRSQHVTGAVSGNGGGAGALSTLLFHYKDDYKNFQFSATSSYFPPTIPEVATEQQQHHYPASATNNNSNNSAISLLEKLIYWSKEYAWPGMGLFGESYLLFSIGTLRPLWTILYPLCFSSTNIIDYAADDAGVSSGLSQMTCSHNLIASLSYSVVLGVITGMILIGTIANTIGRRNGSLLTAFIMASSSLGMTISSIVLTHSPQSLFRSMSVLLFVFGIGVGGEYPISASSASEKAMGAMTAKMSRIEEMEEASRAADEAAAASNATNRCGDDSEKTPTTRNNTITNSSNKISVYSNYFNDTNSTKTTVQQQARGNRVQLVFTMQGMGIFINSLTQTALLMITKQFGNANNSSNDDGNNNNGGEAAAAANNYNIHGYNYNPSILLMIWRIIYILGASFLLFVFVSRYMYLKESEVWKADRKRRAFAIARRVELSRRLAADDEEDNFDGDRSNKKKAKATMVDGIHSNSTAKMNLIEQHRNFFGTSGGMAYNEDYPRSSPMLLLLKNYGVRLFGTSFSWLLWDVAFYGNKLFQSSFLTALAGENITLLEISAAATLNAFVALLGYFAAAAVVDNPKIGRLGLQQYGFAFTGFLFVACGFLYGILSPAWLGLMYLGSSFFGQCGPNCTTFLIPAEIFPTEVRTMCHGISASAGKLGALIAAVVFNFLDKKQLFLVSGYASFAACVITFFCIPETTTLDLHELDRKWRMIMDDRRGEYFGPASDPEYLSYYERQKLGLTYLY